MYKAFQPQDAELHWDVVYNSLLCAMQGKRIHKGMELTQIYILFMLYHLLCLDISYYHSMLH